MREIEDGGRAETLLARLGSRVVAAEPITTLRSPRARRLAVRLTLADGRTVKLRQLRRRARAERSRRILETLGDARYAAVILVDGDLVVEEWIAGTPLSERPPASAHVERAAAMLAALHRTPAFEGAELGGLAATSGIVRTTLARLRLLRAHGVLDAEEAARLAALARRLAPGTAAAGITHNDFCGENLVADRAGELRVVDNEALDVGFFDYDLARTWYRWSLDGPLWETFLASYVAAGGRRPPAGPVGFWRIAAAAKSARTRWARATVGLDVAVAALRRVMTAGG